MFTITGTVILRILVNTVTSRPTLSLLFLAFCLLSDLYVAVSTVLHRTAPSHSLTTGLWLARRAGRSKCGETVRRHRPTIATVEAVSLRPSTCS